MKRAGLFSGLRGAGTRAKAAADAAAENVGRQDYGDEAYETYHEALRVAEQAYDDARGAAEDAYHVAQAKADALIAQGARLTAEAAARGRDYGARAARGTRDNKPVALLLAAGVGYLLALAFKRRAF